MATRATYQINGVTFYIHWDGYPAGAAAYFWQAFQRLNHAAGNDRSDERGGLMEAFVRANVSAEHCAGHDIHGDTEYRYTVDGHTLTAQERTDSGWPTIWAGDWREFINAHVRPDMFEAQERPERIVQVGKAWLTPTLAETILKRRAAAFVEYVTRHPRMIGNVNAMAQDVERARAILAEVTEKAAQPDKAA